ncbi:cytochrome P450 46A1 [Decorospora gaudefroyi]|uniref:Cytochrome P450 46A1 n=1 Tax=Decorospora gaudefroyi TaxID=184978 RepID=A0A6A5KGB9_9PLEO|nr:cytochrome P450 46A1 [Decorospora gaudefroyi]
MPTTSEEGPQGLSMLLTFIPRIFATLTTLLLIRFIIRAIYRVYFHPLSKFPGPKLYAATRIPWVISTVRGTRNDVLRDLHQKYGHVVRINHDELSFTDPDCWKDIDGHGTKGTAGSLPHKYWARYGTAPNGTHNIISTRDEDHTRQRKIFTPAFSDRALKQQEPLFVRYADQLVLKLREGVENRSDKKFDMVRMYNYATFDVMADLTFGESLHMLENDEYDPWVTTIFGGLKIGSWFGILQYYPWLWRAFKRYVPESVNKKRMDFFNHSVERVTKRLEKGHNTEGLDLWDLVLSQKEGRGLTRAEMDANSFLFMIAGTETTATLLSGLTFLLLCNPECMKKLRDEIRSAFASSDDMTMEKLAMLPYLAACVKEALRVYPPVPLGLARITPDDGSTIVGRFIPPNTTIVISQHAMYTHPKNFKRPTEFLPQRWLGDKEFENDERQCVQPFIVGSRDCLGKNMAYHEMRLLLAKLLYNLDIELCPESNHWMVGQKTYFLWEKQPLFCKVKAVN